MVGLRVEEEGIFLTCTRDNGETSLWQGDDGG